MRSLLILSLITLSMLSVNQQMNAQVQMSAAKQHLSTIAALEAKGDLKNLEPAINAGLDDGLTVNQVKEALSQLYAYTGFPRSLNALGVLQQVVASREQQGKATVTGPDAAPLPSDYDALKQGTEVQTRLSGGNLSTTPLLRRTTTISRRTSLATFLPATHSLRPSAKSSP